MQKVNGCAGECWSGFVGCLVRRKQVDPTVAKAEGFQLAKRLSVIDLIAIGKLFISLRRMLGFVWIQTVYL
ncbi:hypothetical protein Hanom_Chr02g00162861 [Helianthus anomalus]